MTTFKAGGRELALCFNLSAMDALEQELGQPIELADVKERIVEQTKERKKLLTILRVLAEEGAAVAGSEPPEEAWLKRHVRPGDLPRAQVAIFEAVAAGMSMETADGDEDEEVDVVLEELKKKAGTGG